MKKIMYFSTNKDLEGGFSRPVSFKEALIMGQAPDEGLFMPIVIPRFSPGELLDLMRTPYPEIAAAVLRKFLEGTGISYEELRGICWDAYKDFSVPLEHVTRRKYIMRLDRGPTASFKDFAARLMARLMAYYKNPGQKLHVLVATSGDTGSAVGEAFKGVEGTRVTILYPADEVSGRQKKQLDTIGGNVQAIAVDGGKFDDCQDMVKAAFTDPDLAKTGLTSANSINIGRILPQIIYYFYAWCQLADGVEPIIFSIPSGNFGDMMGAEYAWRMGLPIAKLIVSTNENDEFPLFMTTGKYAKISPSRACLSNAMNVGHPSNLARLFCLYGGTVDKTGKVWKYPNLEKMRERIFAVSVTDDETRYAIVRAHEEHNIILEPHGAVGWRGLEVYNNICPRTNAFLSVCLETAHPAKFPEQIKELLGVDPELPDSLKAIDGRIGEPIKMAADYGELKEYLLAR